MPRLIDADALREHFMQHEREARTYRAFESADSWGGAVHDVEDAPTIDAEPVRRGEWIKVREMCGEIYGTCSRCGTERARLTSSGKIFEAYCLDCGAKMTEVQDG